MRGKPDYRQPSFDFSAPPAESKPMQAPAPAEQKPSNGLSHAARLKARQGKLTLFDFDYSQEQPEPDAEQAAPAAHYNALSKVSRPAFTPSSRLCVGTLPIRI